MKAQTSIELAVLLVAVLACAGIGSYFYVTNISESGSYVEENADNLSESLLSSSENSLNSLSDEFIELSSGGSASNLNIDYWIDSTSKLWVKLNTTQSTEILVSTQNSYESLGENTFYEFNTSNKLNVTDLITSYHATHIITDEGNAYSIGYNYYWQLGTGVGDRTSLTKINLSNVSKIFSCSQRTHLITLDGTAYSFGDNAVGQLGLGDYVNRSTPVQFNLANITNIVHASYASSALLSNGEVWSWGRDTYDGILGVGKGSYTYNIPHKVSISNVTQISAGDDFVLLLTNSGEVYGYGSGIGLGIGQWENAYYPTKSPYLSNIVQISCGDDSSYALDADGKLYAFGSNDYGELGIGSASTAPTLVPTLVPFNQPIKKIYGGRDKAYILTENGDVYVTGKNNAYCMGMSTSESYSKSTFTYNPYLEHVENLYVDSHEYHIFAKCANGTILGWGLNSYYQLCTGDRVTACYPTIIDFNILPSTEKIINEINCELQYSEDLQTHFYIKKLESDPEIIKEIINETTIKYTISPIADGENCQISLNISDLNLENTNELLSVIQN